MKAPSSFTQPEAVAAALVAAHTTGDGWTSIRRIVAWCAVNLTTYMEPQSVSARLRDLRKIGVTVERRLSPEWRGRPWPRFYEYRTPAPVYACAHTDAIHHEARHA